MRQQSLASQGSFEKYGRKSRREHLIRKASKGAVILLSRELLNMQRQQQSART